MTDYENNPHSNIPEPQFQQHPMPPQEKKQKNHYASSALMFGVFSIINTCSFMFPMAIIMGVSAVCFAVFSKDKNEQEPKMTRAAVVGLVMGMISITFGIIEFFAMLSIYDMMKDPELIPYFNDAFEKLETYMQQNIL